MTLTAHDPALPIDVLHVAPWPDPVLEVTGHDPRSSYVERFWLALLGPSTSDVAPVFGSLLHACGLKLHRSTNKIASVHNFLPPPDPTGIAAALRR